MATGKRTMTLKQTKMFQEVLFKLQSALESKSDVQASIALDLESILKTEGFITKPAITKPATDAKRAGGNVHANSSNNRRSVGNTFKKPVHENA